MASDGHWENRRLIVVEKSMHDIIVTDKDIALMNVVQIVFATSINFLCQLHIDSLHLILFKIVTTLCLDT